MLRPGQVVFLCALTLLALGVVMVNSAGMHVEPVEIVPVGAPAPPTALSGLGDAMERVLLARPTIYMALAVLAMGAASLAPIGRLAGISGGGGLYGKNGGMGSGRSAGGGIAVLAVGVLVLLAVISTAYIPGLGRMVNGSQRWISLPLPGLRAISVQPSELVKWGLIGVLAAYGSIRAAAMPSFWRGLVPGLLALGLVAGAVASEDLGTGVLIAGAGSIVLLAAGARFWHFLLFVPVGLAGFVFLVIASPYRIERLRSFVDPYVDPKGSGYHMIQSMAAVANGEGFGRGLGFGLQKFGYLPEDTTDFLFAVVCEELGIAGAAIVVSLYIAMLWAGLAIVRKQSSNLLKLLGLGIIATFGLQAIINLAVVTGLGPTKGIALPLVSAGGTGWILTAASLGVLAAMDRLSSQSERSAQEPSEITRGRPAIAGA